MASNYTELFTEKGVPQDMAERAAQVLEREVRTGKNDRTPEEQAIISQVWRLYTDKIREEKAVV